MDLEKIVIFYLAFFLGGYESLLGMDLAKAEAGRSSSELIKLCSSTDSNMVAYCEGYIDSAMHTWKFMTACASKTNNNQSFCAGAKSAQKAIQEALKACQDCNLGSFKPELKDKTIRGQLFMERMREFPKELRATIGICSPDEHHDEHYCSGYNTEVVNEVADISMLYSSHLPNEARDMGMGHAAGDVGIHLWASAEFFEFVPCLKRAIDSDQARNIFLKFMRDNPEQQRGTTAIMALEKALYYSVCPGPALVGVKPHMEQCTTWEYDNGYFGTKNTCDQAVLIQFMTKDKRTIERQLNPGETFRTSMSREYDWWMFTACPAGYVSSIAFLRENDESIRTSGYSCIKK